MLENNDIDDVFEFAIFCCIIDIIQYLFIEDQMPTFRK